MSNVESNEDNSGLDSEAFLAPQYTLLSSEDLDSISVDKICQFFHDAAKDAIKTKDFISYSTLIDIYLSNSNNYNDDEMEKLLATLHEILRNDVEFNNNELIYEIGWDLPEVLINFIESSSFKFKSYLSNAPCIKSSLSIFDLLARYGNPKELFLKACELLSSLKCHFKENQNDKEDEQKETGDANKDEENQNEDQLNLELLVDQFSNDELKERFFDIKFHSLLELLLASLKRIHTNSPSKFLVMAITALLKLLNNNVDEILNLSFLARRLYVFARDYIPPLPLDPPKDSTFDNIYQFSEDELYLQRKLLQSFITHLAELSLKYTDLSLSLSFYSQLQLKFSLCNKPVISKSKSNKETSKNKTNNNDFSNAIQKNIRNYRSTNDEMLKEITLRLMELSQSFDLNLEEIFEADFINYSKELYLKILLEKGTLNIISNSIKDQNLREEFIIREIFRISNDDFKRNSLISMNGNGFSKKIGNDNDNDGIKLSKIGLLYICFFSFSEKLDSNEEMTKKKIISSLLNFKDVLLLSIRFLIPVLSISNDKNLTLSDFLSFRIAEKRNTVYTEIKDCILFGLWLSISRECLTNNDIKDISKDKNLRIFLKILLQTLTTIISVDEKENNIRQSIYTLIVKILSLSDEEFCWEFLKDSIEFCPYSNARIAMVGILKDLLTRNKPVIKDSISNIEENLKGMKIGENPSEEKTEILKQSQSQPPSLPPRSSKFITLTNPRLQEIIELFKRSVEETFTVSINKDDDENFTISLDLESKKSKYTNGIDENDFKLLLTYLNLLIGIKNMVPKEIIQKDVVSLIEETVKEFKEVAGKNPKENSPNVDLLLFILENFSK
ncbi:DUF1760-domain-containing protein [Ascoidea rubescens DSM 1968]|uniref:DUF1760-domain-containing protein n=1 Tax=Ascoidea rubescens DSM 1968 TaxID=1344418 RepID=A0A1D2VDQ6_9ASCO|nr:DUF1760-domain-containing protein [Ascoidea rubescens DSM 1968]ODV59765.1 DUF1760-domain-containing protein [Ascoidea rubescens DSM 1968]